MSTNSKQEAGRITRADIEAPDALSRIFSTDRLTRALKRIRDRDSDDLINHPLKKPLIVEFESTLCTQLAELVPNGQWKPEPAYLCLTHKRSGTFRDLVFPTLADSIVGRCLIDALEPEITRDDDDLAFAGRQHFSNNRETGDYTSWFSVWRDFSAAVDKAAESGGFAYVYESDVADFFPSIDRARALQMLAQRTGAHSSLLALLRYCLEAWLPRIQYSAMTGIPIDCNDVSNLVAHNYLKSVDSEFKSIAQCEYLRYVDDTVVFVSTEEAARELAELHHMRLREIGLNPSPSKTRIVTVSDYQEPRHRDENEEVERIKIDRDEGSLREFVGQWYSLDRAKTASWDKVTRRIYTAAKLLKSDAMQPMVFQDVLLTPSVARHAMRYLSSFELGEGTVTDLERVARTDNLDMAVAIELARCCADARFPKECSSRLAQMALEQIYRRTIETPGIGYVKGQWLLVLFKHGSFKQRSAGLRASFGTVDDQWRLHHALVRFAHGDSGTSAPLNLVSLGTSDYRLMLRLCASAMRGRLKRPKQTLDKCVTYVNGAYGIAARYLPLVAIIMRADHQRETKERWLTRLRSGKGRGEIRDVVIRQHIERWHTTLFA